MLIVEQQQQQYLKICGNCNGKERRRSFSTESPFSICCIDSDFNRQTNNTLTIWWCILLQYLKTGQLNWGLAVVTMGTKMKGIYKGFTKTLSQIFVVKEREMEIGHPTDVKHVAHIGWDGPSGTAPTWMNSFKTGPDFAATSVGNSGSALSPWSSLDFGESMPQRSGSEMFEDTPPSSSKKKQKRKKSKSTSSPKSVSSASRSSRAAKSKSKLVEGNANSMKIEVV